ncbi:hypothetical protein BpHYR1_046582 [Brachionus plicatilis]|uniref:Uncharacterized protein n=1 Tax=Brachionus plicatilis TaxID=10195 RepID=A0A3M7RNK5_BRAPC|nr:hypothetical protein BpHYR1_046582 [Brachionus plicatilis]
MKQILIVVAHQIFLMNSVIPKARTRTRKKILLKPGPGPLKNLLKHGPGLLDSNIRTPDKIY